MASTLLLVSIFMWQTETVQAISCAPIDAERIQSGLDEFEAVFIGEVIEVDYPDPDSVQLFSMKASSWGDPFPGFTYLMFIDSVENPSFDSPDFAAGCRNWIVNEIDFDYAIILGDGYDPTAGSNSSNKPVEENSGENSMSIVVILLLISLIVIGLIGLLLGIRLMNGKKSSQKCEQCGAGSLIEVNRETLEANTVEQHGGGMGGGGDIRLRTKEEVTYRCSNCDQTITQVVMKTN